MFDLVWVARFKDNSWLEQYDKDGTEHKFQEVLDRQDELVNFALCNRLNKVGYIVDLTNGCISCTREGDYMIPPREDMLPKTEYKYRLIYFREIERTFGSNLKEIGQPKVLFFLGYQYTDEDGKSHKFMMRIDSEGRWTSR